MPVNAKSLRLRALGPIAVFLGDTPIALQSFGGGLDAGDIAAYSGQTLELSLVNLSNSLGSPVAVDDIVFPPLAVVPELSSFACFAVGLLGLWGVCIPFQPFGPEVGEVDSPVEQSEVAIGKA